MQMPEEQPRIPNNDLRMILLLSSIPDDKQTDENFEVLLNLTAEWLPSMATELLQLRNTVKGLYEIATNPGRYSGRVCSKCMDIDKRRIPDHLCPKCDPAHYYNRDKPPT